MSVSTVTRAHNQATGLGSAARRVVETPITAKRKTPEQ
jgi:hypothetical protein